MSSPERALPFTHAFYKRRALLGPRVYRSVYWDVNVVGLSPPRGSHLVNYSVTSRVMPVISPDPATVLIAPTIFAHTFFLWMLVKICKIDVLRFLNRQSAPPPPPPLLFTYNFAPNDRLRGGGGMGL